MSNPCSMYDDWYTSYGYYPDESYTDEDDSDNGDYYYEEDYPVEDEEDLIDAEVEWDIKE